MSRWAAMVRSRRLQWWYGSAAALWFIFDHGFLGLRFQRRRWFGVGFLVAIPSFYTSSSFVDSRSTSSLQTANDNSEFVASWTDFKPFSTSATQCAILCITQFEKSSAVMQFMMTFSDMSINLRRPGLDGLNWMVYIDISDGLYKFNWVKFYYFLHECFMDDVQWLGGYFSTYY
ncbi:hypothetical protein OROHE_014048 [Orobanche hederae]